MTGGRSTGMVAARTVMHRMVIVRGNVPGPHRRPRLVTRNAGLDAPWMRGSRPIDCAMVRAMHSCRPSRRLEAHAPREKQNDESHEQLTHIRENRRMDLEDQARWQRLSLRSDANVARRRRFEKLGIEVTRGRYLTLFAEGTRPTTSAPRCDRQRGGQRR
jgi:hypothetical protein